MADETESEDDYDDGIIESAPEYSKKSEYNKPKQVETVMNRALELKSKSMHPQYVNTSQSSDGTIKRETVEDSREQYVNAVTAVLITLSPELNRSKERKKKIEELEEQKEKAYKKYCYQDYEPYAEAEGNRFKVIPRGEPYIPDYDSIVRIKKVKPGGQLQEVKGYCNQQNYSYWSEMIKISDNILKELQSLADDLNYFKQKTRF